MSIDRNGPCRQKLLSKFQAFCGILSKTRTFAHRHRDKSREGTERRRFTAHPPDLVHLHYSYGITTNLSGFPFQRATGTSPIPS